MSEVIELIRGRSEGEEVCFDRRELDELLSLYTRRVIGGEWKDYAIDHGNGRATFSIFRNAIDRPLFTVVKYAPGTHRNGDYAVYRGRFRLKRGKSLAAALDVLERQPRLVSS